MMGGGPGRGIYAADIGVEPDAMAVGAVQTVVVGDEEVGFVVAGDIFVVSGGKVWHEGRRKKGIGGLGGSRIYMGDGSGTCIIACYEVGRHIVPHNDVYERVAIELDGEEAALLMTLGA
jgi:hypothetical protein